MDVIWGYLGSVKAGDGCEIKFQLIEDFVTDVRTEAKYTLIAINEVTYITEVATLSLVETTNFACCRMSSQRVGRFDYFSFYKSA